MSASAEASAALSFGRDAMAFRGDLLRLLAACFLEPPQEETVRALCAPETVEVLAALVGEAAVEPLRGVRAGSSAELRQEFFDLLAVPTTRYLTPFESVHCDRREIDGQLVGGLLAGASARAVEQIYGHHGFALAVPELPDHLGCELGFLAELCRREVEARDAGDAAGAGDLERARQRFAREHAGRFALGVCRRLEEATAYDFFAGVARLTAALVAQEAAEPE